MCSLDGVNLPGSRLGLSRGAFFESDVSGDDIGDLGIGALSSSYRMLSSGSEPLSRSRTDSLGSTGCFSFALSETKERILWYVILVLLGFIRIFNDSVLGGLPKCASNGFIFVIELATSLIYCFIFATI